LWIAESTAAIMLASSRCLEMWSPYWGRRVLAEKFTWIWLLIPTVCAVYFVIWTRPIIFTGLYMSWFFNPHVGYLDSFNPEYENMPHSLHNLMVLCGLTGIYVVFSIVFYSKTRSMDPGEHRSSSQKK
ncbi:SRT-27 protein, partial [Aphelenchoides avenae]